jgi:hypothetical protein
MNFLKFSLARKNILDFSISVSAGRMNQTPCFDIGVTLNSGWWGKCAAAEKLATHRLMRPLGFVLNIWFTTHRRWQT